MVILKKIIFSIAILSLLFSANSQGQNKSEIEKISEVIMLYIDGTANGKPEKLKKAFHPNYNLYTITNDSLWIRSGKEYVGNIKKGVKRNRIGELYL